MYFKNQLADVAAGAKALDVTAGAAETYYLMLVFG